MNNIKLGNIVKDISSGFQGTACMFLTDIVGVRHIEIQPPCEPGVSVMPKAESFDYHMVEFVADGVADKVCPQDVVTVKLGDAVVEKITQFEGIATAKIESMQGCVQFVVTPITLTDTGRYPEAIMFDHKRLDVVEGGVTIDIPSSDTGCIPRSRHNTPAVRRC